jgi:hypothetical protein
MQPSNDEIAIPPASLVNHANHIDAVADEVDEAKVAATQVRLDSGAYGQICTFVPPYLNGLSDGLMSGLEGALTSLRDAASGLRAAAVLFEEAETSAAGNFDGVVSR